MQSFQRQSVGTDEDAKVQVLNRAYEGNVRGIKKQKAAFRVLAWITCVTRRLRVSELQHALAVKGGETQVDDDNTPRINDLVSICAGLVMVDK